MAPTTTPDLTPTEQRLIAGIAASLRRQDMASHRDQIIHEELVQAILLADLALEGSARTQP